MFLVIPLVEFRRVLGVDIDVHHENPATFLCHMSVSSVERSDQSFASSYWHPVLTPVAQERHEIPTGEASQRTFPRFPGLLSAIFRLIEAHRNEIRAQPASFATNRSGCSPRSHSLPGNLPHTTPALAQLTVPPASSQEGEDDNERDVSAHIPVEACEGGMPDVLLSAIAPS